MGSSNFVQGNDYLLPRLNFGKTYRLKLHPEINGWLIPLLEIILPQFTDESKTEIVCGSEIFSGDLGFLSL